MDINPFNLLFHPHRTVARAIEKPNFSKSFFIVLLPSVLLLLSLLAIDPSFQSGTMFSLLAYALKSYLFWFIASAMIYFFVFLAKGKAMKGKFAPIYSAVSMIWLFVSIAVIVVILASFVFSPKFFGLLALVQRENLTADQGVQLARIVVGNDSAGLVQFKQETNIQEDLRPLLLGEGEELVNSQAMLAAMLICLVLFFYALFIYPFLAIKQITKLNAAASFVLYIVSMGLVFMIAAGVSYF